MLRLSFCRPRAGWIYKSGDLAVQLEDGRLEFEAGLTQVNSRLRIELGEVGSVLRESAGVKAAVVRAVELEPGDRRLVAFVVG